ncbi:unnamed protein product [Orchesella dallaii]|uniref:CCDC113/CCDC96 coiled-coil domain-containing protein n=1 Tax=Orchesella dallaii TaxID=48710 RepID=A0ABP1QPU9_9HEXA
MADDDADELEALRAAMLSKKDEADDFYINPDDFDEEEEEEEDSEEEEEDDEEEDEEEMSDEDEWETEEDDAEDDFDFIYDSNESFDIPPSPKRSLPDVEGALPKAILRKLPNSTIRKIIVHVKKHILMLETENYLYETTIQKLEASEKEMDTRVPNNAEEFEDFLKKTRVLICSSDSEPEPEDTGEYEAVNAANVIRMSQDSFFENMSDNSKATAFTFFKTVGDLAPPNYDVMRHKVRTRLNTNIFQSRVQLDEKMNSAAAAVLKPGGRNSSDTVQKASITSSQSVEDEDFTGFNLADAKKLSITDRLRFALEEEEEFRNRFYHHETQALKEESSIQVHIDAHKHALAILMGIRKDFRMIAKGASGIGMNGKLMADLLVKFRRKMRNQLSAEETKARITIRKVRAQKKRTLEQLKINKEAGRGISHIDFEYLLCESSILETEITGMNTTLQHLKDLTAQFHLVLQEERQMLDKMHGQEDKMNHELKRRHDLLHHFHDSYVKYRHQIVEANMRMDAIKKKLSDSHAPQPLDYIRLKATQYELESDVRILERKLEDVNHNLTNIRNNYNKCIKSLPSGRTTEMENSAWLDEIKKEVEEQGLMSLIDDEPPSTFVDEEDMSSLIMDTEVLMAPRSKSVRGLSIAELQSLPRRSTVRLKNVPSILLAPRRFDVHKAQAKRSKTPIYDLDFDFDFDMETYDEELDLNKTDNEEKVVVAE